MMGFLPVMKKICASGHSFLTYAGMSLAKYKEKRSFTKTPEPTGGKAAGTR
jgi:hypothetical protein